MKKKKLKQRIKDLEKIILHEEKKYKDALYDDDQLSRAMQRVVYEQKEGLKKIF